MLRPEFLYNYDHSLKSDTLRDYSIPQARKEKDLDDLSNANMFLKSQVVKNLTKLFDELKIMPIDSKSLTSTLHEYGVNVRYLSHIYIMSKCSHIKDICLTEMFARTCKNIMN